MSRVNEGSDVLFHRPVDIEDYLLRCIDQNANKKVGAESEFFFVSPEGKAITVEDGQKAFASFKKNFEARGLEVSAQSEQHAGRAYVTGLSVKHLGNIDLETGHGFEFATDICNGPGHVLTSERVFFGVLADVERDINYKSAFTGYAPEYAEPVPIMRQRSNAVRNSYIERFGEAADLILKVQGSTASTQMNVDAGQDAFHEVFRALLIADPALSLHYTDQTGREYLRKKAYVPLVPEQVNPLVDVWDCRDNRAAIHCIVERLMRVHVPFMPSKEGEYIKMPLDPATRQPPTVGEIMERQGISERELKNIMTLSQTHPALRRPAVIEVRGPDSIGSAEKIAELSGHVTRIAYDKDVRRDLLREFRHFSKQEICELHHVTAWPHHDQAMKRTIGGKAVSDIVQAVVEISRMPHPPLSQQHVTQGGLGFNETRPNNGYSEKYVL